MRRFMATISLVLACSLWACSPGPPPSLIVGAQVNGNFVKQCLAGSGFTPSGPLEVHAVWPSPPITPITTGTALANGSFLQMITQPRGRCDAGSGNYPDVDFIAVDQTTSNIGAAAVHQGYFCPSITQPGPDPNWQKCCSIAGC
jgi:hypothetical protein